MSIKNDDSKIANVQTSPSNLVFIQVMKTKTKDGNTDLFIFNGNLEASMVLFVRKVVSKKNTVEFYGVTKKGIAKSVSGNIEKIVSDGLLKKLGSMEDIDSSQPQEKK